MPRPSDRISDLQEFVRRFSANASKARQATSRKRQLEKIKIEEIRPSSRQNPYIRFEQAKKLYRSAVTVERLTFSYPGADADVLNNLSFNVEAGERIAIIGPNGIGKTTLMRCLAGELKPTAGRITWVENAQPGYMPQDPQAEFDPKSRPVHAGCRTGPARRTTIRSCARRWAGCCSRATRPRRSVKVLSGGEKGRMIYGKLMLTKPNVLLMDEPTNHMDMETIESLQIGLEKYAGHADFRLARPRVRRRPRDAHHRAAARDGADRLQGHLRRVLEVARHRSLEGLRRDPQPVPVVPNGSLPRSSAAPFHSTWMPMQNSRKADSRTMIVVPVGPIRSASRAECR